MTHVFKHGWNRQKPDSRDRKLVAPPSVYVETVTMVKGMPAIMDQGNIGSCTAHGSLAAFEFCLFQPGVFTEALSRLQVYYDTRVLGGGDPSQDSGGEIRDAVKVLATIGAAPEGLWPYDVGQFAVKPPQAVYAAAVQKEALEYRAVEETVAGVKGALALGLPVIIGFDVSSNFMDIGSDGIMPDPAGDVEGGHCVCVVGFTDRDYMDGPLGLIPAGHFIVRNSWGLGWGRAGHFLMPYDTLAASSASDFWVISETGGGE
jgi:C1A family cysteine protease